MFSRTDSSRYWLLLLGLLLVAALAVACGPTAAPTSQPTATPQPTSTPTPSPTPAPTPTASPTATPVPIASPTVPPVTRPGVSVVAVQAPIESVAIEAPEDPSQFVLVIVSGLRDSCESFDQARVSGSGDNLTVTVTNLRQVGQNVVCAMVYGMVTTEIPLSGDYEVCKTYTVVVNGQPYSVLATAPNVDCAPGEQPPVTPTPGVDGEARVQIKVGETVPVGAEGLAITLLRVPEDSRCPKDAVCVWAGQATVVINVKLGERGLGDVSLTLGPDQPGLASATLGGYTITLARLDPYPESAGQISPEDYIAFLVVSKN